MKPVNLMWRSGDVFEGDNCHCAALRHCCAGFFADVDENGRFRRAGDDGLAKIQSSLTMTLPVKDDEDVAAQQQTALRSFYKVAAGSCAMVLDTVADTCEVTSVTTNVNARDRSMGGAAGSQMTVTGQIAMKVKFKASIGKPAQ